MKRAALILCVLLLAVSIIGCTAGDPLTDDLYVTDIWGNQATFNSLIVGGVPVTGGTGLPSWEEISIPANEVAVLTGEAPLGSNFQSGYAYFFADEKTIPPFTVVANKDNDIVENDPTANYGTLTYVVVRAHLAGNAMRGILEYPVVWGTNVPAGATITNVTEYLDYYAYESSAGYADPVGRQIDAYRLLRTDLSETQSDWLHYKTDNHWTTAGAYSNGNDYTTTDAVHAHIPASFGWMTFDITEQGKTAQTNNTNIISLLKDSSEVSGTYYLPYFHSRDFATGAKRPYIVITYTSDFTVFFTVELPHNYKEGTDVTVNVHWAFRNDEIGTCVKWRLSTSWANEGIAFPVPTNSWALSNPSNNDNSVHQVTKFAPTDGSGKEISSLILCYLQRNSSDASDNYTDVAMFLSVSVLYQVDSLGSTNEWSK